MEPAPPVQRIYNLRDLSDAGYETAITASAAELAGIADWESVDAVTRFEGRVTLKRLSQTRFAYDAELIADIVQHCVVTLEPLKMHIMRNFSRMLHYMPGRHDEMGGIVSLTSVEDEGPEEIDSLKFDLTGPLLEEFSLAIDPYPRSPGVQFKPLADETAKPESPFAVLKGLKQG